MLEHVRFVEDNTRIKTAITRHNNSCQKYLVYSRRNSSDSAIEQLTDWRPDQLFYEFTFNTFWWLTFRLILWSLRDCHEKSWSGGWKFEQPGKMSKTFFSYSCFRAHCGFCLSMLSLSAHSYRHHFIILKLSPKSISGVHRIRDWAIFEILQICVFM